MGKARPLKLLNIATWLISTCLHPCPFYLHLGDHALVPCILASCVYMHRQEQETKTSNGKKEMCRACERGIKQTNMIAMASKETRKQARRQTKGAVHRGQM